MFGKPNGGPSGFVLISDPTAKTSVIELETMQCVHCGKHWIYRPGSGAQRGFCMKCRGVTCGSVECDPCVPFEARVEIVEGAGSITINPYLDEFLRIKSGKLVL